MKLQIKGKKLNKMDKEFVRLYVAFVLGKFVSKKKLKRTQVTIRFANPKSFKGDDRSDLIKFLAWMTRDSKRKYTIIINENTIKSKKDPLLRVKTALHCLGHELVHVKQYVNKEMFDHKDGSTSWKGKRFHDWDDPLEYWFTPWELEAYGHEDGLYEVFREKVVLSLILG